MCFNLRFPNKPLTQWLGWTEWQPFQFILLHMHSAKTTRYHGQEFLFTFRLPVSHDFGSIC